jgi:hypothetical protein
MSPLSPRPSKVLWQEGDQPEPVTSKNPLVGIEVIVAQGRGRRLLSDEHFTVDGTLLEAWAGQKSFRQKDAPPGPPPDDPGNPTVNFHGERRSNQTHQSTTDPDSRLYKKATVKVAQCLDAVRCRRVGSCRC